jgi:hypothetical protein
VAFDLDKLALPFATRKQAAILWYLATNRNFFERARNKLKPQWFTDHIVAKVYTALLEFAANPQYGRLPTIPELLECRGFMVEEAAVRSAMRAAVAYAENESKVYGLDVLKNELTEWLHAYIYKEGSELADHHFRAQRFSEAYKIAAERTKLIQDTKFEDDYEYDFSNLEVGLLESETRVLQGCTFGLKSVDDALTPGGVATNGGLFRRDTTCLMAPVNIGKTTAMLSAVAANVMSNRRVLLVIHEGEPSDIRDKLLMHMLHVTKPELWALRTTPPGRAILVSMEKVLKQGLTFIPYIKAQMTVEDVIPILRRKCEEAAAEGRPYDLLANDYPALLMSEYAKSARMEDRSRIEMVYLIFTQLANEMNLHCLVNIQTNRDGSRANRAEDRLLGMEDVSESWGAMAKVANVITVNRSPNDMMKNRVTYHIVKSRSSGTGKAIVARTNFDRAIAHSDREGYGSVWYHGSGRMIPSEELDMYIPQIQSGEITAARIAEYEAQAAAAKQQAKEAKKVATAT